MSHAAFMVALSPQDIEKHGDVEEVVAWQMAPFDEESEMFRNGSRWDWYTIGGRFDGLLMGKNVLQVKKLAPNRMDKVRRKSYASTWEKAQKEKDMPDGILEMVYGVKRGETLDQYMARAYTGWFPATAAFLRNRAWHEHSRMGWFEAEAATECEIARPGAKPHKCLFRDKASGASIVSWQNAPDWGSRFYDRFIKPLTPDTTLVVVDYHV